MNFLLTKYIYPIDAPIAISKRNNFSLDNPRTEKEIDAIYNYISKSYDVNHEYDMGGPRVPVENTPEYPEGNVTLTNTLQLFKENYGGKNRYIKSFFSKNSKDSVFKLISKMWVIARFDDKGSSKELEDRFNQLRGEDPEARFFTILNDDHPLVSIPKKMINFSTLLSLLIQKDLEGLEINSFIIQKDFERIEDFKIDRKVNNSILEFVYFAHRNKVNHDSDYWSNFHFAKDLIVIESQKLDSIDEENHVKILESVSEILASLLDVFVDQKLQVVTLTSILEMMLTHNPDYNRFNVEDSISKQFKLKTSLVLYLYDPLISLDETHKRLGEIYSQRSSIAHGNFSALEKYIQKKYREGLKDNPEYEKCFVIEEVNQDLILYIKVVIEKFLEDPGLIKYLKKN
ncbi:hypothetical protein OS175_10020 [Marinicella sp. S1101]|uniref:hypothetical protein n=1 Tax=Marinicella marina TaxID=2996016 RepID=UPI002260A07D|nr:hypothetical protein [Marinicella marina]MCX7554215.1 hypothetical protein [Marinicella marina]MDJ1141092.1 hypothetical protein [Marinicella marina]